MAAEAAFVAEIDVLADELFRAIDIFLEVFPKRDLSKVIGQQAKLLARDLLKLTPPNKGLSLNTSFATQRKIGQNAVAGQVNQVFADIRTLGIFVNPKKPAVGEHARQLLDGRRYDELQKFLVDCGYGYRVRENSVIQEPTEATHNRYRDKRGRVHENLKTKFWVGVRGSVLKFSKKKQKLVGKEKAGWVPGAQSVGQDAPAWVRGQSKISGSAQVKLDQADPEVSFRNSVSYAVESETEVRFVAMALKMRKTALLRQVQAALDGRIKRLSGV
jgi:hypothetical protein